MRYIRGYVTMIQAQAYVNGLADAGVDTSKMCIVENKDRYVSTGHTYSVYDCNDSIQYVASTSNAETINSNVNLSLNSNNEDNANDHQ